MEANVSCHVTTSSFLERGRSSDRTQIFWDCNSSVADGIEIGDGRDELALAK